MSTPMRPPITKIQENLDAMKWGPSTLAYVPGVKTTRPDGRAAQRWLSLDRYDTPESAEQAAHDILRSLGGETTEDLAVEPVACKVTVSERTR